MAGQGKLWLVPGKATVPEREEPGWTTACFAGVAWAQPLRMPCRTDASKTGTSPCEPWLL